MSQVRAEARINLAAIERNCERLRRELAPDVLLCAAVKANGYGHGAVESARAALAGGASWFGVASVGEAQQLRGAGLEDPRILVMGLLSPEELRGALEVRADVVVWNERSLQAVVAAGGGRVHVKLDTGMGRLGTRDPAQASRVVQSAQEAPGIELVGIMTHFATADEGDGFFEGQLEAFSEWVESVRRDHPGVLVHAANSAAVLRTSRAHFDMVRCGVAIYGLDPFGENPQARSLEPALELRSYLAEVKPCAPGESAGYGRRFVAKHATHIGVLPIGYGDGWRRGLSNNAEVLIGGRRKPIVGTVSMDNVTVDLGPDPRVESLRGTPAILIGRDGGGQILAEEIARRLDTINYEVTCAVSARVPRVYHRDGESAR